MQWVAGYCSRCNKWDAIHHNKGYMCLGCLGLLALAAKYEKEHPRVQIEATTEKIEKNKRSKKNGK